MYQTTFQKIEQSPFKNIYWFARHLLNSDEYGTLGKSKEKQLLETTARLEALLVQDGVTGEERLKVLKTALFNDILGLTKPSSKVHRLANNLVTKLDGMIVSPEDVAIFCITMRHIVSPINHALDAVPADDIIFCQKSARDILDALGETKAGLVITTWDKMGVAGCLNAERAIVVSEFERLLDNLARLDIKHTSLDDNLAMTAFVQEFERRLGQKRKGRGGTSLEAAVNFLFDYYSFKSSSAPSHFDQDLEVDKWFPCKDGWSIGISCKRTLRERWKQLSQADRGTLSHFKIKELWHLITYDKDLSDDKIVRLGEQGQIFYLMDDSPTYINCANHIGMRSYVRPLSSLVADIRSNMK